MNRTGHELIVRSAADRASTLEKDLSSLNSRWLTVTTTIEQRQARLDKAVTHLKEYQVQKKIYRYKTFSWPRGTVLAWHAGGAGFESPRGLHFVQP